jgi:DNA-binding MarR family transcriptional regulator
MWQSNQKKKELSRDKCSSSSEETQEIAHLLNNLFPDEQTVSGLLRKVESVRRAPAQNLPFPRRALMEIAQGMYVRRRARQRHLPDFMFGEPAWDMMLALYVTADSEPRHTVSNVVRLGGAPPTTGLRYISALEQSGLIVRRPCDVDLRIVYLELSKKGSQAMDQYMMDVLQLD